MSRSLPFFARSCERNDTARPTKITERPLSPAGRVVTYIVAGIVVYAGAVIVGFAISMAIGG